MRLLWKIVLPLVLVVPLAAYVAGTLAGADEGSTPRETIVIQDTGTQDPPKGKPNPPRGERGDQKDDDDAKTRRQGEDDDDVDVVEPQPDDVTAEPRDDRDDDGRQWDGDDDSGDDDSEDGDD